MVFSTILFLCGFLPIVILMYYIMPQAFRNIFLLLVSLFFYAWGEPNFIWIMLLSIISNYGFGMWIGKAGRKKYIVGLAVFLNLSILFIFKYFTFAAETIRSLIGGQFDVIQIALPIGISFYTFQGLSYVIDVYRSEGTMTEDGQVISLVQKNPLDLALYISMFPQLVAGPIVRYTDISANLKKREVTAQKFAQGAERFIIGLAKKAILANMIGKLAADIFASDFSYMGASTAWLGAFAYTLQIYFDFSGYSDMAIGLGKIFGFHFMENFRYPYISTSVREFWRRWHISLSTWFRDYLYIPLGGNRRGNVYVNLLIVFTVTGIWHGAGFSFLLWGLWHGLFLVIERVIIRRKTKTSSENNKYGNIFRCLAGWIYTMLVVMIGWVAFNLPDFSEASSYLSIMFGVCKPIFTGFSIRYYLTNQMCFYLLLGILACIPWKSVIRFKQPVFGMQMIKRFSLLLLLVLSFVFIINNSYNPFIYFRF